MSKPWNFLVYIAADNTLYDFAQVSLRQIVEMSRWTKIKILVQFDGPSAEFATRYVCANGSKTAVWEAADGYTPDRGQRLTDFLNFAIEKGFAGQQKPEDERIFLVLWGHGAGLDHVYLYRDPQDTQFHYPNARVNETDERQEEGDALHPAKPNEAQHPTASEPFDILNSDSAHANRYLGDLRLASILAGFANKVGHKIDLLGFDACLMGLAEICQEIAPSVSLLVASDEELPKGSWPYDSILGDLTRFPGMDSCTLSAVIVSRFIERYTSEQKRTRISLSTYNLEACDALAKAMQDFVTELSAVLGDGIARRKILHARDFSRTPDVPDYIDLGVFCKEIGASFKDKSAVNYWANYVLDLLMDFPYIVYHRDAGENGAIDPLGLAVYFPQILPPTAADVSNATQQDKELKMYRALSGTRPKEVPSGLHVYRPANDTSPFSVSGGGKTALDHTKTELASGKTALDHTKTALDHTKAENGRIRRHLASGRIVQRELVGSEVIWDLYLQLKFNQQTKWGNLIEALITGNPFTVTGK